VAGIFDLAQFRLLDLVLFKLAFDHAQGQLRAKNRHRDTEVLQEIRKCPRVVLVAVGDDDCPQSLLALNHIAVVRQYEVDAGMIVVGKHDARVDHDHVVAIFDHGHILADAVEPAERDDAQTIRLLRCHMPVVSLLSGC